MWCCLVFTTAHSSFYRLFFFHSLFFLSFFPLTFLPTSSSPPTHIITMVSKVRSSLNPSSGHLPFFFCYFNLIVVLFPVLRLRSFLQGSPSPAQLHHPQHPQVVSRFLTSASGDSSNIPRRTTKIVICRINYVFFRVPALGLWGAAAGAGVLFFADSIPRLQRDVYQKIPVVGSYFDKSVPATDSPF